MVKASASSTGGGGSMPDPGAKIPYASWPKKQNIKQKQYCNKFNKKFKNVHIKNKKIKDEGRNQGNAFTSQEMPKIGSKPPESSREHGTDSPAQPSERIKPQ